MGNTQPSNASHAAFSEGVPGEAFSDGAEASNVAPGLALTMMAMAPPPSTPHGYRVLTVQRDGPATRGRLLAVGYHPRPWLLRRSSVRPDGTVDGNDGGGGSGSGDVDGRNDSEAARYAAPQTTNDTDKAVSGEKVEPARSNTASEAADGNAENDDQAHLPLPAASSNTQIETPMSLLEEAARCQALRAALSSAECSSPTLQEAYGWNHELVAYLDVIIRINGRTLVGLRCRGLCSDDFQRC